MVRYRSHHLLNTMREDRGFMPDYDTTWLEFVEGEPSADCVEVGWSDVWEKEEGRDFVHRVNSKNIARYVDVDYTGTSINGTYSTLAIIFCFVIVACIIIPQVLQILSALFVSTSRPPPTPPSPPQVPKSRKRLRLYHFREVI